MNLTQLIYASEPFGFEDAILAGILVSARRNNARDKITGCLICRHDLYLQLLEGPEAAIDRLFARIAVDDRHLEVQCLSRAAVTERMFPGWLMRDDPARSWLWSPDEVARGALRTASVEELRGVFVRVAA